MIACYIEGFKDGRTLMLAADHAAKLRKPIVMVKVGKTAAGRSMAQSHTGHLTGSDAVTSAVFRQFGVTRVDGLDELLEVSMSFARTRPEKVPAWAKANKQPGVCVYAISGGTGAHMADVLSDAGLRLPDLTKDSQRQLHDSLIPTYLRVSNPVDCGGPPVADARGRRILDVLLADKNVDILVIPITGAVAIFSDPFTRDIIDVARDFVEAHLRGVGRAGGYRRHVLQATARRRLTGVPHVPQLRGRGEELRRLLDILGALPLALRRRADRTAARGGQGPQAPRRPRAGRGPLGVELEEADPRVRHQDVERRAVCVVGGSRARREEDRVPGGDEGLVTRPAAQDRGRRRQGRGRLDGRGEGDVRRPVAQGEEGRLGSAHRRCDGVRDGQRRRRHADRRLDRRAVRSGRDHRRRRHLRRSLRRRHVPGAAILRGGSPPGARASSRVSSCSKAYAVRPPSTSTRWSTPS